MLIYLYGSDSYRSREKLKEIQTEYEGKNSALGMQNFDLDNNKNEIERLRNFTASQSLFDIKKFGVVHNLKNEHKELKNFFKDLIDNKNTLLVLVSEKKLGKDFSYLLKKPVVSDEFQELKGVELVSFIKKELGKRKIESSLETIDALVKTFEGNLWGIINEIEKISLGAKSEKTISPPQFFTLIQKIKNKGPLNYRLPALTYLLETQEPAAVFNVTASIADPRLKIKMADLDIAIKSGKLEYREALLYMVLSS